MKYSYCKNGLPLSVAAAILFSIQSSYAHAFYSPAFLSQCLSTNTLDCGHWYIGGAMGVSHLFDKKAPGSRDSVNQNGPGWNVNGGFQFNSILGAEIGYNQYHASRETIGGFFGSTTIAQTEHYAAYLAATAKYPLWCKFSVLGKLGPAYSYANKIFSSGISASSGAVSAFYGLGLAYNASPAFDFNLLWSRVRGNNYTGSSDLYALGFTMAVV